MKRDIRKVARDRWRLSFLLAHIIQSVLIFVLLWNYDFVKGSSTVPGSVFAIFGLQIPVSHIEMAKENPDALQVAYNVGVLELASISLTVLGILLALAAVIGFGAVRSAAIREANKAAEDEVAATLPDMARVWFETEGRSIIAASVEASQAKGTRPEIIISEEAEDSVVKSATEIKGGL